MFDLLIKVCNLVCIPLIFPCHTLTQLPQHIYGALFELMVKECGMEQTTRMVLNKDSSVTGVEQQLSGGTSVLYAEDPWLTLQLLQIKGSDCRYYEKTST